MADWTASVLRMRTTSSGGGNTVGIVTGLGDTPGQALDALRQQAEQLAQQAGEKAAEAADRADQKAAERKARAAKEAEDRRRAKRERLRQKSSGSGWPEPLEPGGPARPPETASVTPARRHWWFEVIDVRLTPAPQDAQASGWLAYGTLTFEGAPPQATTTGSAQTGTGRAGGSRDDRSRDDRSWGGREGR
jgi:hypothetical protein